MRLIVYFALMLLSIQAFSQEEAFYIEFQKVELSNALAEIEETYAVIFSYKDEYVQGISISLKGEKRTLKQLLDELNIQTKLNFENYEKRYVIITKGISENQYVHLLDQVMIRSYITKGVEKNKDGSYTLKPEKIEILPGLIEPDVLESIQLLPGVLSPNETATGFFVRGGFADQNRLIWDGINLYHKGHLFGMISPLNPNITSTIKFTNKGTHPKYGERLSSVIDITSKNNISSELKAEIGLNGLSADALVEIPIIKDKMNVIASIRRSYTELVETPTFNQMANKVFESTKISQNTGGENDFYFSDYNIKLNYQPNENNTFFASFINIDNKLDYLLNQSDAAASFNDILNIANTGYGVGWKKKWSNKLEQNIQAFFSDYKLNYNFVTLENSEQVSVFEKRNTIFDSGFSIDFDYNPSQVLQYSFGYQYTLKDVAYAFLNRSNSTFILDTEDSTVQSHSVFSNVSYTDFKWFDFSLGLRGTYFKELDEVRFEPRIQLSKAINPNFRMQATGEVRNQIINEVDETVFSDLSLENNVWRLSNDTDFPIKNSLQTTLGFIYNKNSYSIDVDTYYKKLENIAALSLGFLNPENTGFNIGEQSVYGIDVFFKKRFNKFNAWTSYSLNNARSTFENVNNNASFKSISNVSHAISTSLSYKLNDFQFSLGWKWQTGRPYTVANANEEGELVFDEGVNTGQLPAYHRLDFSSTYMFKMDSKNKLKGKVGFSIRNLYNRRSLISREYRGNNDFTEPVEVIDRFSLGLTPNVLFRVYW